MLGNRAIAAGSPAVATDRRSTASGAHPLVDAERIRRALQARRDELTMEYERAVADTQVLQTAETTERTGDDQTDYGTKSAERETAHSLILAILDRRKQFDRALARLDAGTYGRCEGCGTAIPIERLEIFPCATACVSCQQARERRGG
ncbi:MAG TPA: TraR/DksA C4-type zinc finger protein [Micromonospora sp.]